MINEFFNLWLKQRRQSITVPPRPKYHSSEVEIIETADGYALRRVSTGEWWGYRVPAWGEDTRWCADGVINKSAVRMYYKDFKAATDKAAALEAALDHQEDRRLAVIALEERRKHFVERRVWR